jgi:AcrR family transcriptional regulator
VAERRAPGAKPRPPLNREQVLAAAIRLADEQGLEAVSMRRLGERLGVEAMSLYNHVANKDSLLDGMEDAVLGEIPLPADTSDWKTAMRRRAVSFREVLSRHPWSAALIGTRAHPGQEALRYADWVLGCLRRAGFESDLAQRAFWVIDAYIYGFVTQQASLGMDEGTAEEAGEYTRSLPMEEYPYLVEASLRYAEGPGWDFDQEFRWGLDLLLDSLDSRKEGR